MKSFSTYGRVRPERDYIVLRTEEVSDFINRIKAGRYIVLFAPRQTGKTTFFRLALDALATEDPTYFPIQLDFQTMRNAAPITFYERLYYGHSVVRFPNALALGYKTANCLCEEINLTFTYKCGITLVSC